MISTVKIGPFVHKILFKKAHEMGEDAKEAIFGLYKAHLLEIWINEDYSLQQQALYLFHEILHGIWFVGNIETCGKDEEYLVTSLSTNIMQVWGDNPKVFDWIKLNLITNKG